MRYDVKKYLFIGMAEEKMAFFRKAQQAGVIHFIEPAASTRKEVSDGIHQITAAIKILRRLPLLEQEHLRELTLAEGVVNEILQLHHEREKLAEEERVLLLEIERVGVFGDFAVEDIAYIEEEGHCKVQFFFSQHGFSVEHPLPSEMIYVGTDHNLDYYIAINKEPKQYEKFVEMRIEHPVGELKRRSTATEQRLHEVDHRLKGYAKYQTFLHHALIHQLNSYHLHQAQENVQMEMDDSLFVVQAWVPVNQIALIEQLVAERFVHMEEIAIEPTDAVPTYLENEGTARIGEDLVHIYDTPSITDKDPSLWVLASFALFFAFIVGDGGYGMLFFASALYLRYKFPMMQGAKKRVWKLLLILSVSCIGWGLLTNSFFGISFGEASPMRQVSLINWLVTKKTAYHIQHRDAVYDYWVNRFPALHGVEDPTQFMYRASTASGGSVTPELINKFSDNIMMELALFIGTLHILISMLRYLPRNWTFLGWIPFVIGGYLYIPYYLDATSLIHFVFGFDSAAAAKVGLDLIYGGLALAVVISIFKNKWLGLTEVMTSIQIFSDILSYLRLYALGLAGAIVTSVINEAAGSIPLVFAIILLLLAHAVNMLLAVMGGVIHGLRLNFLEWYHYSFEGGGKRFKPLENLKIEGG
jgi:V/A-type H+-transporting ATPase subunit I